MTGPLKAKSNNTYISVWGTIFSLSLLLLTGCGHGGDKDKAGSVASSRSAGTKDELLGKWTMTDGRTTKTKEFLKNGSCSLSKVVTKEDPETGPDRSSVTISYRLVNGNTVEIFNYYTKEVEETGTFSIEENGECLLWTTNGSTEKYKRVKPD